MPFHSSLLQRRTVILALMAAAACFTACQIFQSQPPASTADGSGVSVELQVRMAALALAAATAPEPTDSAIVTVSAPDMSPHVFGFGSQSFDWNITDLTPGLNRDFSVQLLRQGQVLYTGEIDTTLYADRQNVLLLHCLPHFSRVSASVHVPVDFPWSLDSGRFTLTNANDTLNAVMTHSGEFLYFDVEEVPGGRNYSAALQLWDSTGAMVATSVDTTLQVPMGQNLTLTLPLLTTYSQLQIGISYADPAQTAVSFAFPAGRRAPAAFGDVIFSEVYPAPSTQDSGSQGEWVEFFNRTSDTLDLSGCDLSRDGGGTPSKQFAFAAGTLMPPGKAWVAGHPLAPVTDIVLNSFSLPNSLSRLRLSCSDSALLLDTLTYSFAAADSFAVKASSGEVTELHPDQIANRSAPSAWCLVPSHPDPDSGQGRPTPGSLVDGCPN